MNEAMWAFGRVSGFVSLALFTVSLVLGILTRSGRPLPGIPRFSISLIHRNVALLASVFLIGHVGALMLDSYARLSVADVVVPFIGAYKPFWQGLGTVALDLVLAIVVTSLLRQRLGAKVFKFVHWFTYAMWPITIVHAVGNGTNGTSRLFLVAAGASALAITVAVLWRLSTRFDESAAARSSGAR